MKKLLLVAHPFPFRFAAMAWQSFRSQLSPLVATKAHWFRLPNLNGGLIMVFLVLLMKSGAAQTPTAVAKVTMQELQAIAQQWDGSLTYLDYKTNKPVMLVTTLNGMQSTPQELVLDFIYREPEGGQVKGYDKVQLADDGLSLLWDGVRLQVVRKTRLPNQELELVLEGPGLDDNKKCLIRKTVLLGPKQFSVQKEVKYDSAKDFVTRNKYAFQQSAK